MQIHGTTSHSLNLQCLFSYRQKSIVGNGRTITRKHRQIKLGEQKRISPMLPHHEKRIVCLQNSLRYLRDAFHLIRFYNASSRCSANQKSPSTSALCVLKSSHCVSTDKRFTHTAQATDNYVCYSLKLMLFVR